MFYKRPLRLLLRRLFIRASRDEQDLERSERWTCRKTWVLLAIPVACFLCVQVPRASVIISQSTAVELVSQELAVVDTEVDNVKKHYLRGPKMPIEKIRVFKVKQVGSLLRRKRIDRTPREPTTHSIFVKGQSDGKHMPSTKSPLPECVIEKQLTETMSLNTTRIQVSLDEVYPMVQPGGYYRPPDCYTKHKVAILVPYRNRTRNLTTFLFNIHPFLINQKLEYRIFVIEQVGLDKFNKGRLFNAGFKEMKKYGEWKCVVFHDVDLLPLSGRILYTCPAYPRHMSSGVIDRVTSNNASSPILFGGVTAMTLEHYERANGHSNMYWGWGGEDYDMFWRLRAAGFPIVRYNKTVARYLALPHHRERVNPLRYRLLRSAMDRWQDEGLADLEYRVESSFNRHLFTHIRVNVKPSGDDNQ